MNENDRVFLRKLIEKIIGSSQEGRYQKEILITNVSRRIQRTNSTDLYDYLNLINNDSREYAQFLSSITIHTTNWFREMPHYQQIEAHVRANIDSFRGKVFQAVSVASSTGEEVYSLAFVLEGIRKDFPYFNYIVEGRDVDPISVHTGNRGIYPVNVLSNIPAKYHPYIKKGKDKAKDFFCIGEEVKKRCQFKEGNLTDTPKKTEENHYDYIMCRNVLIYFDTETVGQIISSLRKQLAETGVLCLGHSETLNNPQEHELKSIGNSNYQILEEKKVSKQKVILIVDDSATVRIVLKNILEQKNYRVLEADCAEKADSVLKEKEVDLITLDLHMPGKNGDEWLKYKRSVGMRIPTIIITDTLAQNADEILAILQNGAQDYINKKSLSTGRDEIVDKVTSLINSKAISREVKSSYSLVKSQKLFLPDLILIGASTGGTEALATLLKSWPSNSPPVLVVQHISKNFCAPFAKHLAPVSGLKLGTPKHGATLEKGHIYLAHDEYHIGAGKRDGLYRFEINRGPAINRHRPSVDHLFVSALSYSEKVAAILLTGMGEDGAKGMLSLKNKGAITFAQNEQSCVVFGMPKAAIENGGAGFVGNLSEIRVQCERFIRLK